MWKLGHSSLLLGNSYTTTPRTTPLATLAKISNNKVLFITYSLTCIVKESESD